MTKIEMTESIIVAKKVLGLSWEEIASKLALGEVFLTSASLGMNSLSEDKADKLCEVLNLDKEVSIALQEYPKKEWDKTIPNDPLVYRFYEIVGVYGDTLREVIGEKFGDGIMSAIDFSMDVSKEENPAGDRVVVTMNGKFLPYKSW
jgi:cyanate lyase